MTRGYLVTAIAVLLLSISARWSTAGYVLADLSEAEPLEVIDADVPINPGRTADLLLVTALRERLAAGALTLSLRVPVLPVADDRGPRLDGRETGRGDTCVASYVAKRLSATPKEACTWAAALTSLKMEAEGPIKKSIADVEELMRLAYTGKTEA